MTREQYLFYILDRAWRMQARINRRPMSAPAMALLLAKINAEQFAKEDYELVELSVWATAHLKIDGAYLVLRHMKNGSLTCTAYLADSPPSALGRLLSMNRLKDDPGFQSASCFDVYGNLHWKVDAAKIIRNMWEGERAKELSRAVRITDVPMRLIVSGQQCDECRQAPREQPKVSFYVRGEIVIICLACLLKAKHMIIDEIERVAEEETKKRWRLESPSGAANCIATKVVYIGRKNSRRSVSWEANSGGWDPAFLRNTIGEDEPHDTNEGNRTQIPGQPVASDG